MEGNNKIIVILGSTSSGKSDVAIRLAKKFNGEIISADSRQIYRGLDIGTGKITKAEQKLAKHYMIDIVSPRTNYNAAKFKKDAEKIIKDILKRGKLPIICGGTGFWIKAIVDNVIYPEVKPDWKLRNYLRNYSAEKLFTMLKKLDPQRAKSIDAKNKVRLIRAIEICKTLGKVPSPHSTSSNDPLPKGEGGRRNSSSPLGRGCRVFATGEGSKLKPRNYNFLQIGINLPKEKLHQNIEKRLRKRFAKGMIREVENLHSKEKLSWKKIESFGLGYFLIPKYLRGEIATKEELFQKILRAEKDYAKRQMTWFRKDTRIKWIDEYKKTESEINKFLKK
ncbi:MAG: tRNA (adenosine(37)-N6)-dimethylallyltransferase MiaA [Parcubacteria group bacterium]|jgi:tRNA dimethylallyltransferase